jgi:hypothetical protein
MYLFSARHLRFFTKIPHFSTKMPKICYFFTKNRNFFIKNFHFLSVFNLETSISQKKLGWKTESNNFYRFFSSIGQLGESFAELLSTSCNAFS